VDVFILENGAVSSREGSLAEHTQSSADPNVYMANNMVQDSIANGTNLVQLVPEQN
jgi:hypothetical protein